MQSLGLMATCKKWLVTNTSLTLKTRSYANSVASDVQEDSPKL